MQSFALWYEKAKNKPEEVLTAKLNFNLWTECGWKKNPTYFDIGFMISNISLASKIFLFIPFKVEKDNIKDLGRTLESSKLAGAIFNENLLVTNTTTKLIKIENAETSEIFDIYKLDTENQTEENRNIQLDNFDDGTILKIEVEKNPTLSNCTTPLYFRFRLQDIDFSKLIHKYSSGEKGLQSIFNVIYTIDFRYMNKRCLKESLIEKITSENCSKISIEAVHFLLLTKTYVELKTENCFARKLEEDIWDDYVNLDKKSKYRNMTNDLIAYHYKKNFKKPDGTIDRKDSAEFFIKYSVEKTIIRLYLILTILIGALGSLFANIIWKLFTGQ